MRPCWAAILTGVWLVIAGIACGPAAADDGTAGRGDALRQIALALADQIGNAGQTGGPPRLAVLPFADADVPVSPAVAAELHAALLAALRVAGEGRVRLVARDSLKAMIADLDRTSSLEAPVEDPAMALLRRAGQVDLVAVGRMRRTSGGVMLSYRAVRSESAEIQASTAPVLVPLSAAELDPTAARLTLDQAVDAAARYFVLHAGDLRQLELGGIRFETSGAQPAFGRFLQERMAAALETAMASPLSGRRLVVRPVADRTLERGSYVLDGRYWDFGAAIELRLRLRGTGGRTLGWSERILAASAGPLRLRPKGDFGALRDNDGLGPFAFQLATARGTDPAYRIGEELRLYAEAGRDAWLYCFHLSADGALMQFLPNSRLAERGIQGVKLAAGQRTGLTEGPFRSIVFRILPPAGQELVKCFAAGRDIAADLPYELRGQSFDPLGPELAARLSEHFRAVPDAAIAEASVVVTVYE